VLVQRSGQDVLLLGMDRAQEHIVHQCEFISHLEHDGHLVAAEKAAALLALLLDTQRRDTC
jgi:hypothetical protein